MVFETVRQTLHITDGVINNSISLLRIFFIKSLEVCQYFIFFDGFLTIDIVSCDHLFHINIGLYIFFLLDCDVTRLSKQVLKNRIKIGNKFKAHNLSIFLQGFLMLLKWLSLCKLLHMANSTWKIKNYKIE